MQTVATLFRCAAFFLSVCSIKVLVVDVLKMDLGPAVKKSMEHFQAPTFQAQGGNWSSGGTNNEKRDS